MKKFDWIRHSWKWKWKKPKRNRSSWKGNTVPYNPNEHSSIFLNINELCRWRSRKEILFLLTGRSLLDHVYRYISWKQWTRERIDRCSTRLCRSSKKEERRSTKAPMIFFISVVRFHWTTLIQSGKKTRRRSEDDSPRQIPKHFPRILWHDWWRQEMCRTVSQWLSLYSEATNDDEDGILPDPLQIIIQSFDLLFCVLHPYDDYRKRPAFELRRHTTSDSFSIARVHWCVK